MNIQQTQKMNFMIKELTQSGIVSNFDDAVTMASDLYTNGQPSTVMSEPSSSSMESKEEPMTASPSQVSSSEFERIAERKAKNEIQNYAMEMQKELTALKEEVASLKIQMRNQAASQPSQVSQPVQPKVEQEQPQQEAQPQQQLRTETQQEHPRQGKHNPNNVELEDYFYFGVK